MDKEEKKEFLALYIAGALLMANGFGAVIFYFIAVNVGAIVRYGYKVALLSVGLLLAFFGYRLICRAGRRHQALLDQKIARQAARAADLEAIRVNREGLFVALVLRLGLSEHQAAEMVRSMRVPTTSPEDIAAGVNPKVNAAAKQAMHIITRLARRSDAIAGEIIFSLMMLWLDESVIAEDDPLLDEVTSAWGALAGKQRAGLALKAGCASCGNPFLPDDLLEKDGTERYRHKECPARCTSTTVAQLHTEPGLSTEFRCALDVLHFGGHRTGSITWSRKPEEDKAEREAYEAESAEAPKVELTELQSLDQEIAKETACLEQLKGNLEKAKQRTSLYDHEDELVEFQQGEVNFLIEQRAALVEAQGEPGRETDRGDG